MAQYRQLETYSNEKKSLQHIQKKRATVGV